MSPFTGDKKSNVSGLKPPNGPVGAAGAVLRRQQEAPPPDCCSPRGRLHRRQVRLDKYTASGLRLQNKSIAGSNLHIPDKKVMIMFSFKHFNMSLPDSSRCHFFPLFFSPTIVPLARTFLILCIILDKHTHSFNLYTFPLKIWLDLTNANLQQMIIHNLAT